MQSVTGYLGLALLFTWDSPGVVRCAWGGALRLDISKSEKKGHDNKKEISEAVILN